MYIPLGQGVGNMCVAGSRNGPNVNITGQGWDTIRDCPRDSQSAGCENYSGQRRTFIDPGDKNLNLEIHKCASMVVTHQGETLTTKLTQCSVSLDLNATKSNDITAGANGTARLNVGKNCGPVNITIPGSPTVTKDPYGDSYSIEGRNGEFITLNAAQIYQVKLNGKAFKTYLPADPAGSTGASSATGASGATGVTGSNKQYTGKKTTGADLLTFNQGSSRQFIQSQISQAAANKNSSAALVTDSVLSKSAANKSNVVNTTVAPDATAQKSQEVTITPDSSVSEQATQAEIDAKMAANAGAPGAQSMFGANMPMMFQFIYILMGMFQQQGAQQNQPLSPYQQNNYLPWW
jgi:hypothetical protein